MAVVEGIAALLNFFQRQEMNKLAKEEWKLQKQKLDMILDERNQRMALLQSLPPDAQALAMLNPDLGGRLLFYDRLLEKVAGGGGQAQTSGYVPESTPAPYEAPTGEFTTRQGLPNLPRQIAQQNLFGGMSQQDIAKDIAYKELGIGRQTEAVKSDLKIKTPDGKYVYAQILRNGTVVPTQQEIPPEWKETQIDTTAGRFNVLRNMVTGEIDWQSANPVATEVTREKTIGGPTGSQNIAVPKLVMPGQQMPPALPEPIKHEPLTMTGPKGEQETIYINPITGEPMKAQGGEVGPSKAGPISGIKTKPPQPQTVAVAQQTSMMKSGLEALKKVKDAIFDSKTGKINRTNLGAAYLNLPRTEGKRAGDLIGAALNAIRLASTGAAFSPKELTELKAQYVPNYMANDQQVYEQWDMLTKFIQGMLEQMDPNEVYTKSQKTEFEKLMNIPKPKGGVNLPMGSKPKSKYQNMSNEELLKQLEGQ